LAVVVAGSLLFFTSRSGDKAYLDAEIVVEKQRDTVVVEEKTEPFIAQEPVAPEPTPQVAADVDTMQVAIGAETGASELTLVALFGMMVVGAFGLRHVRNV